MKRTIIKIDKDKCNGCGACIKACHEGALQLIGGKAELVSDIYCDGLGACLPECPTGALLIEEREAADFDEEAVQSKLVKENLPLNDLACGCPGTEARVLGKKAAVGVQVQNRQQVQTPAMESELRQWPCQIKLVPAGAPYLENAHLLIAADCTAYAYANMHQDFMKNKITLIGCPKLDDTDYAEKLTAILQQHEIKSITVVRMEVPCCGGIVQAVKKAMLSSEKMIPWQVVTISTEGNIIEE
jgi:ferredoxin